MKKELKIYTSFRSTKQDYKISDDDSNEIKLLKEILNMNLKKRIYQSGTVFMHSCAFSEIFSTKLKGTNREKRFIKIKSLKTGKTVYRILRAKTGSYELKDILYADSETRDILTDSNPDQPVELEITKSNRLLNFSHNYDLYNRLSFKIAMLSLVLGLLSLVIALIK